MKTLKKFPNNICSQFAKVLITFLVVASMAIGPVQAQNLDVPYVPTPQKVVDKMLDMAEVQEGDYVIDLGSGDGRIVISAVKRGAYGHGIDLNPERIEEARQNAREQNLEDQVMFVQGDIFKADFARASVITMYLLSSVNQELRPKLLNQLEPGTRIVSHSFSMGDWKPDKKATVSPESATRTHTIYYWVIPARVEGTWKWQIDGHTTKIAINQKYQEIDIKTTDDAWKASEAVLNGKRISFKLTNGKITRLYSGRVEGNSISGIVQTYKDDDQSIGKWSATHN